MIFGNKNKNKKVPSPCDSCKAESTKPPFQLDDMLKEKMKELEKNKVKPQDCPWIQTCKAKILGQDYQVLCKDQEGQSAELKMVHMKGKHIWELCKDFYVNQISVQGKTPKEWADAEKS